MGLFLLLLLSTNIDTMTETNCENCKTLVASESKFCPKCGFPEHGTYEEQEEFYDDYNMKLREVHDLQGSVDDAMRIMLYIGIFTVIAGIGNIVYDDIIMGISSLVIGITFIILHFWSNANTFAPILIGLVIYSTFTLLIILFIGIELSLILRAFILFIMARSLNHGHQLKALTEELKKKE